MPVSRLPSSLGEQGKFALRMLPRSWSAKEVCPEGVQPSLETGPSARLPEAFRNEFRCNSPPPEARSELQIPVFPAMEFPHGPQHPFCLSGVGNFQPFGEQFAHLQWKPDDDITGETCSGFGSRDQNPFDFMIVQSGDHRCYHDADRTTGFRQLAKREQSPSGGRRARLH